MKKILISLFIAFLLSGSYIYSFPTLSPTTGVIFTSTENHLSNRGNNSQTLGAGNIVKSGKSCNYFTAFFYIGYIFYGPGGLSVKDAMEEGGIKKVAVIDYQSTNALLYLFTKECIVVWGE